MIPTTWTLPDPESDDEDKPTSTAILDLLQARPCTVDDAAGSLSLERTDAVRYLDLLHRRGLVKRRRAGNRIFYYLTGEAVVLGV